MDPLAQAGQETVGQVARRFLQFPRTGLVGAAAATSSASSGRAHLAAISFTLPAAVPRSFTTIAAAGLFAAVTAVTATTARGAASTLPARALFRDGLFRTQREQAALVLFGTDAHLHSQAKPDGWDGASQCRRPAVLFQHVAVVIGQRTGEQVIEGPFLVAGADGFFGLLPQRQRFGGRRRFTVPRIVGHPATTAKARGLTVNTPVRCALCVVFVKPGFAVRRRGTLLVVVGHPFFREGVMFSAATATSITTTFTTTFTTTGRVLATAAAATGGLFSTPRAACSGGMFTTTGARGAHAHRATCRTTSGTRRTHPHRTADRSTSLLFRCRLFVRASVEAPSEASCCCGAPAGGPVAGGGGGPPVDDAELLAEETCVLPEPPQPASSTRRDRHAGIVNNRNMERNLTDG